MPARTTVFFLSVLIREICGQIGSCTLHDDALKITMRAGFLFLNCEAVAAISHAGKTVGINHITNLNHEVMGFTRS